ncbi:MAG: glycerophosphodiester phosphodiesterase [candidate division NC10 bacterium]|nr:glycerophosphodiester phosphodiesterase [candidate division NC10 bacterium]
MRRVLNIAHRGASADAPENTLPAFQAALAAGADALELDVHMAADGALVVIHDAILGRTTNGRGPVRAHSLPELKQLDAGAWFGPAFAGTSVPTLEEVVALSRGHARLFVEIKGGSDFYPGIELAVIRCLKEGGALREAVVMSFAHHALLAVRSAAPEVETAALLEGRPADPGAVAAAAGAGGLFLEHQLITARERVLTAAAGLRLYAWTVDDEAQMRRLVDLGLDGIVTNCPGRLRRLLDESA